VPNLVTWQLAQPFAMTDSTSQRGGIGRGRGGRKGEPSATSDDIIKASRMAATGVLSYAEAAKRFEGLKEASEAAEGGASQATAQAQASTSSDSDQRGAPRRQDPHADLPADVRIALHCSFVEPAPDLTLAVLR
jgi:hypothetical protein